MDLRARLAARGCAVSPPKVDEAGRACGPPGPPELREDEGSSVVQRQMRGFAAAVLANCTVADLREVCRRRGLASMGSKEE
eukprot:CAMPEP_0198548288 /NCGR_PEP_ID=MMETSP1462-20131121/69629_1 /TAXON_ID=1333877 /ORGANISM="Brandtodinium nutriculum, Strain RCC3387" /LENGTH=80 /DNA_ID=CAMNT_0044278809 /DNA_START=62 /DNA_END=301 /DNA_ORIENTATION=+